MRLHEILQPWVLTQPKARMDAFLWAPSFDKRLGEVDAQHRHLVSLVNL